MSTTEKQLIKKREDTRPKNQSISDRAYYDYDTEKEVLKLRDTGMKKISPDDIGDYNVATEELIGNLRRENKKLLKQNELLEYDKFFGDAKKGIKQTPLETQPPAASAQTINTGTQQEQQSQCCIIL